MRRLTLRQILLAIAIGALLARPSRAILPVPALNKLATLTCVAQARC